MEEKEYFNVQQVPKDWWRPRDEEDDQASEPRLRAAQVVREELTLLEEEVEEDGKEEKKKKKKVEKEAFILFNVLTPAECQRIIESSERAGYLPMREFGATRTNTRLIIEDSDLTERVWRRVAAHVPATITKYGQQTWAVQGLNHRWRLCKYIPGQLCGPHVDACYKKSARERSHYTFMLYLNEGFDGGATVFLEASKRMDVRPRTGMALVFDHNILHEGEVLRSDTKYIMRSEVVYQRVPQSE